MPLSVVDFIWRCMHAFVSIDITWRDMHAFVNDRFYLEVHAIVSGIFYLEVHTCHCQWYILPRCACLPLSVVNFTGGACMSLPVVCVTWRCMHAFISGRFYLEVHACINCQHRYYLEVHACICQCSLLHRGAYMPLSVVEFTWRCMYAFASGICYLEVHACLCHWSILFGDAYMHLSA